MQNRLPHWLLGTFRSNQLAFQRAQMLLLSLLSLHIHLNSPEDLTDDYAARIREWLELVRGTAPEVQVDVQPDTTSGG
jgi:hypothetical protein